MAARHPVIVLWTTPRSVSTSFEQMVRQRGDLTVFDEPFGDAYYGGPDRSSPRFPDREGPSLDEVVSTIDDAARERPVFVKELAYQAAGRLDPDLLAGYRNSFLVRDPAASLASLAKQWPDFSEQETGWADLDRAADLVVEVGQPLVVVDSHALCHDPEPVVRSWCDAMDLPFEVDALRWEAELHEDWESWEEWHTTTSRSTGFAPLPDPPAPPEEPRLAAAYAAAVPVYERLVAHAR